MAAKTYFLNFSRPETTSGLSRNPTPWRGRFIMATGTLLIVHQSKEMSNA